MPLLYAKTGEQCTRVRYNDAVNDLPARILARIVSLRVPILVIYALLVPLAALRAARIRSEGGLDLERCCARPRGRGARPARRGPVRAVLARAPVRRGLRPVLSLLRRPGRRDVPPALSIGAHASRVRPVARVRGGAGGGGGRTSRLHLHRRLG